MQRAYIIIVEPAPALLTLRVEERLYEGWQLAGGAFIVNRWWQKQMWGQTLVKHQQA